MGAVSPDPAQYNKLLTGVVTVTTAGTIVALASSTTGVHSVLVRALSTNTGNVAIVPLGQLLATGYLLAPGDAVSIVIADLAKVYVDTATNGNKVCYLAT